MPGRVSAILLAAGSSRRMGTCKQLLPFGGRPAIVRCLESIRGAGIDDIVVVVGPGGDEIMRAMENFPATVAKNEVPQSDMSQSVRLALAKVDPAASAVFVCLADHPLVRADTLTALREHYAKNPGRIVIPVYGGRNGHPPLLPREILAEIDAVPTLRDVVARHSEKVIRFNVADEGVVLEMDTWEDYQRLLKRFPAAG